MLSCLVFGVIYLVYYDDFFLLVSLGLVKLINLFLH